MTNRPTRTLAVVAAVAALGIGGGVPVALASHGADDPAGHDAGDDHGGARRAHELHHRGRAHEVRHRNREDRGCHHGRHHRRHHNDDGPNHT